MKVQLSNNFMEFKRSTLSRIEILKHAEKRSAESKTTESSKRRSLRSPFPASAPVLDMQTIHAEVFYPQSELTHAEDLDYDAVDSDLGPDQSHLCNETELMDMASSRQEIQQNSRFLDLPTELRIRIFDCLLERTLPVCLLISTNTYLWGQGLPKDIATCARVCKSLNAEVQDIIWERLNFKIRADNGHGLPSSTSLGPTESCKLLSRMRRIEVCFPIAAIKGLEDPGPDVLRRLKVCAKVLEKCSAAREITFNCDTNAYVGEHDDKGVDLVTRAFRDVLVLKRAQGAKVLFTNTNLQRSSSTCLQLLREAGLMG